MARCQEPRTPDRTSVDLECSGSVQNSDSRRIVSSPPGARSGGRDLPAPDQEVPTSARARHAAKVGETASWTAPDEGERIWFLGTLGGGGRGGGGGSVEHAGKARARSAGLTFCGRATARPATVASPSYSTEPPVMVSVATAVAVAGTRDIEGGRAQGRVRVRPSPYRASLADRSGTGDLQRRSRWGGRLPDSQMNVDQTPGGTRTAASGRESPASSPFRPRGKKLRRQARTCALAINSRASCRLDHAGTMRAEAAGLEPANGS